MNQWINDNGEKVFSDQPTLSFGIHEKDRTAKNVPHLHQFFPIQPTFLTTRTPNQVPEWNKETEISERINGTESEELQETAKGQMPSWFQHQHC